ncbi:hydroxycinnamoyltransferase [Typha latifolia]|uniref:hydroxycinnamoyltransferase n=1 Tax=Typha latifolia TaxID=4733 RepID=UPI003C2AE1A6
MTAGARSRVTILAKSTAVSVTPVRPGKTYPLSILDRSMGRHTVRLVFYYRFGTWLDPVKLKESLSEVLSYYPAMTGRMTRQGEEEGGGWLVKCNDAGVRMLEARADATLDEWLRSASDEEELELAYWEPMGQDPFLWSPFYVQLTEFKDKSYAIGLSCTHMHADPTCAILFLHAWADIHRRLAIVFPPFFHPPAFLPRPSPNPVSPLLSLKSITTSSVNTAAAVSSVTFLFSSAAVRRLIADCSASSASPFDALASLFWLRIARASHVKGGATAQYLTLAVDFRKRMQAPLPFGFYGNALFLSRASANLEAGWGSVADEVARHVEGMQEEDLWSAVEWLHAHSSSGGGEPFRMYGPELTCLKLDHVPVKSVEFEPGVGPEHVACRVGDVEGEGLIVVMEAPASAEKGEGEGDVSLARMVVLTLPTELTTELCGDDDILQYGPTIAFPPKA